ncbi:MAG: glycogen synthase, partial [bacterium]
LPQALKRLRNCEVRVLLPNYLTIPAKFRKQMTQLTTFIVEIGTKQAVYAGLLTIKRGSVRYYFIDNEYYFFRDRVYDFGDEAERFAFFQKAAIAAIPFLDFVPDVIHVHDWHAAMIPLLLRVQHPEYASIKTILTIHNLAYQGIFPADDHRLFNLDYDSRFEFEGRLNFLKCGIVTADLVTTVSKTYAAEIMTDYYGYGMQRLLQGRAASLQGIMNGIAFKDFDPMTDGKIPQNYGQADVGAGKRACKAGLFAVLGVDFALDRPCVGIVSRLVGQKGFDLIKRILVEMLETDDFSLVVLGDGEKQYNEFFRETAAAWPRKLHAVIGYNDALARKIYAGCDLFLMPSKFEPCGLGQLIALRYGTLPLVRETGGLADSVKAFNEFSDEGTGFSFTNYNAHDMMHVLRYAFSIYSNNRPAWDRMVQRAMAADFSWEASARIYKKTYQKLMKNKGV